MTWQWIIGTFAIPAALAVIAWECVRDREQLPKPGAIPDNVTRWREQPNFKVLDETEQPFDWAAHELN